METKASHDAPSQPQALLDFMSRHWIDEPTSAEPMQHSDVFLERRKRLAAGYPGAYLVIPAGLEITRTNGAAYRFRPSSDFVYLVGAGEPGALLILAPTANGHEAILFVPEHNRGKPEFFTDRVYGELWVGAHRGVEESRTYFCVEDCRPLSEIPQYLQNIRKSGSDVLLLRGQDETVDASFERDEREAELASGLGEMRLIKDTLEISELRKCCAITKKGFEDAIRLFRSAPTERDIEVAFWSRARREGNETGYLTIAAAGHHSCTLHWIRNNGSISKGDLVLIDAGVEAESLYTSDITRTLPVSGTFTAEQRAVYDIVYAAQQAGFEAVKPGNDFLEPHRAAMRVLTQGLIDLGVLNVSLDEALDPEKQYYRRYTLHGVSHMLGLDVHDCAKARSEVYRYGQLRPGMVLTVEPGLYLQPDDATVPEHLRGIGIRIEDDVLVTSSGHENLSSALPSEATRVEQWVQELNAYSGSDCAPVLGRG